MPVHHHHRVVHVHIPKTAGTALGEMFADLGDLRWRADDWYGLAERDGRNYELQHLTHLELHELSGGRYDDFRSFAVVRDPYQRLISEFYWRRGVGSGDPSSPVKPMASMDELVAAIPHDLAFEWQQYIALADRRHANLLIHLRPQWHYLSDHSGDPVDSVEVIRFEHLADELRRLLERWQISSSIEPRPNRPKSIADHFTDETLAVVNEVYARDFERFGYPLLTEPVDPPQSSR